MIYRTPMLSDRERIRRWRKVVHMRLFHAIGLILLAYTWLTLLPALWWSDISRDAAFGLTAWFVMAQVLAVRVTWGWLSPSWRREKLDKREDGEA